MRKQDLDFVLMVTKDLLQRGMGLRLQKNIATDETGACGWNDSTEIFVGIKRPQYKWIPILAHEWAHTLIDETIKDIKEINECCIMVNSETPDNVGYWKSLDLKTRIDVCKVVQRYEYLVETKARKIIKQYNLSHNERNENICGNLYILSYSVLPYIPTTVWGKKALGDVHLLTMRMPEDMFMPIEWFDKPIEKLKWYRKEVLQELIRDTTFEKLGIKTKGDKDALLKSWS